MDELNTAAAQPIQPIGSEQVKELTIILQKYKTGKVHTEHRIVASENWWKLRNNAEEAGRSLTMAVGGFKSASGWLHNVIVSKHADAMDNYPEPHIMPREPDDRPEANILSSIIPCILEQNQFEDTYSDVQWQKLKTGTGVYKITWDQNKLNGLGDISIAKVNLLNLYWEPGITDIQNSRYVFHTELVDLDLLKEQYPELEGQLKGGNSFFSTKFLYDDTVSTDGKITVIECYYHKFINGRNTLQYVKYVNDVVIYATENIPEMAAAGLYGHQKFPYVFDNLFPIEGSPCSYGFVDICRNPQTAIDLLNTSFVKNAMAGSVPRVFQRTDGGINEDEYLDLTKAVIHVNGPIDDTAIKIAQHQTLDPVYVNLLDRYIQELRETSGNTETSTGNISSGVTAASAIASLQDAAGKGSRDASRNSYSAYRKLIDMCIELIRQFYDLPRQFRIVGRMGAEEFVTYTNQGLQPQSQGMAFGVDMGFRLPVFDIKVKAQKNSVSQNELALQFYQLGFFNPQNVDQALMTIEMMEFEGKDEVMQKISLNGTMFQRLIQYMQLALTLAAKAAPDMVQGLSNDIMQTMGQAPTGAMAGGMGSMGASAPVSLNENRNPIAEKAKARTQNSTKVHGDAITGRAK